VDAWGRGTISLFAGRCVVPGDFRRGNGARVVRLRVFAGDERLDWTTRERESTCVLAGRWVLRGDFVPCKRATSCRANGRLLCGYACLRVEGGFGVGPPGDGINRRLGRALRCARRLPAVPGGGSCAATRVCQWTECLGRGHRERGSTGVWLRAVSAERLPAVPVGVLCARPVFAGWSDSDWTARERESTSVLAGRWVLLSWQCGIDAGCPFFLVFEYSI
jgi:hypothetical protein